MTSFEKPLNWSITNKHCSGGQIKRLRAERLTIVRTISARVVRTICFDGLAFHGSFPWPSTDRRKTCHCDSSGARLAGHIKSQADAIAITHLCWGSTSQVRESAYGCEAERVNATASLAYTVNLIILDKWTSASARTRTRATGNPDTSNRQGHPGDREREGAWEGCNY